MEVTGIGLPRVNMLLWEVRQRMSEQKKTNPWTMQLTTLSIVLIPVAVGINFVGKWIAAALKLPLWLDSIGTAVAAMLAGPLIGGFSGAINNIVFGITVDPISFWYLIPSFLIGLTVGSLAFMGWMSNFRRVLLLGLIVALVASLSSTPINVGLWEGQTGNVWGDALYAALVARGWPIWIASFLNSLVVDIPDKLLTVIVSYLIVRALPERITGLFVGGRREVERL